jgi:hypothetical protein
MNTRDNTLLNSKSLCNYSFIKVMCPSYKEENIIWIKRKVWKEGDMTKSEVLRCLEGMSKTMGNRSQDSPSSGHYLTPRTY